MKSLSHQPRSPVYSRRRLHVKYNPAPSNLSFGGFDISLLNLWCDKSIQQYQPIICFYTIAVRYWALADINRWTTTYLLNRNNARWITTTVDNKDLNQCRPTQYATAFRMHIRGLNKYTLSTILLNHSHRVHQIHQLLWLPPGGLWRTIKVVQGPLYAYLSVLVCLLWWIHPSNLIHLAAGRHLAEKAPSPSSGCR